MEKRGQAATEFLTTYGWMILILIIVVAALGAFNIFKPNLPNKCDSVSPIFCSDVKAINDNEVSDARSVTLVLSASGTSIKNPPDLRTKLASVHITSPVVRTCVPLSVSDYNVIPTNSYKQIKCQFMPGLAKGAKFSGVANVTYYLQETESLGLNAPRHSQLITFSGTIE